MSTQEVITYIEEQKKAGFSRTDIEQALRASGWSAADIAVAFGDVPAPPPVSSPTSTSPEAFLAEMERRREAARAAQPQVDATATQYPLPQAIPPVSQEKGLIGFLINRGIVSTKEQANNVLIVVFIIVVAITLWYNFA